jgi:hypothetical protein
MVIRCSKAVDNSNELALLKATHYAEVKVKKSINHLLLMSEQSLACD